MWRFRCRLQESNNWESVPRRIPNTSSVWKKIIVCNFLVPTCEVPCCTKNCSHTVISVVDTENVDVRSWVKWFLTSRGKKRWNITEPSPQKVVAVVYENLTTGLVSEDSGAFYRIGIVYGRGRTWGFDIMLELGRQGEINKLNKRDPNQFGLKGGSKLNLPTVTWRYFCPTFF